MLFNGEDLYQKSEAAMRGIRGKKISLIFQDPMTCLLYTSKALFLQKIQNTGAAPVVWHNDRIKSNARNQQLLYAVIPLSLIHI